MKTRKDILLGLLEFDGQVDELVAALKQYPWDAETALVVLTRKQVDRALQGYFSGDLTERQIEFWANAIEGREDVDFEVGHEDVIQEAIHQLANPLLVALLSKESAEHLRDTLQ